MKYLLVVDVQKEFVKDRQGQKIYDKCLSYIASAHDNGYNAVIAAVYKADGEFVNMKRLVKWDDMHRIENLDFIPDQMCMHSGYSISDYPYVTHLDQIDIIGFDTDACVLSACFHVFDMGCNMRILTDLMWSSGGKKMHEAAIAIMERQFGKAVV